MPISTEHVTVLLSDKGVGVELRSGANAVSELQDERQPALERTRPPCATRPRLDSGCWVSPCSSHPGPVRPFAESQDP
jgi:hypothetical protein